MSTKKILITGGGGFVAPYLLSCLEPSWDAILHVRNMAAARLPVLRPGWKVFSGPLTLANLLENVSADCRLVVHLAGAINGPSVNSILESNIGSTCNVLGFMRERQVPHLVFMSTAAVWDDSNGVSLDEHSDPRPTTPYGFAKLSAECLIRDAVAHGEIASAAILRGNNTYGRGSIQGVIAAFRTCLLQGRPLQIDGDGQQLREPLHITDLVDILLRSFELGPGVHLYGVSGPQPLTILEMARTMAELHGHDLEIEWQPRREDRSHHLLISTEKARRELDWIPKMLFADGIRSLLY
jgi:UDP-glucose 4-epimerase